MTWLNSIWGLSRFVWGRVALVLWVLRHPSVPTAAKVMALLAVVYGVMPLDLVPDFIPMLGLIDDAAIVPALILLALATVIHATLERHGARQEPHSGFTVQQA